MTRKLKIYLSEVTERTKLVATIPSPTLTDSTHKRLIIRVPEVRKLVKQEYSFYKLSPTKIITIWDYIWKNTEHYEVAHQALYYYQHKAISKPEYLRIKTWIDRCDCWEHSDDLSKIYAQIVEDNPIWILPTLEKWNISKAPWKRRQSVVGLIEYASKRKKVLPFETLITFVKPLLADEAYYVQKGVGWTLREIYNVYPTPALDFINTNLGILTPIVFSTSTEKLDKPEKTRMKAARKKLRQRN